MNPSAWVREVTRNRAASRAGQATGNAPEPVALRPAPALSPADGRLVSLRGAAARIGDRTLWSGVDLDIGAGEFVAVLGPNGVGKTVLVKILLGLLRPAAGEVRVLGASAGHANHRIGYLPQRRGFDVSVRVRGADIVRLGFDGDRWGTPLPWPARFSARRRAVRARIADVIELVGASAYAHRPIGACSGGEQQRLLIAQALVRRPQLLLLDEPLDGLDLPSQASAAALISRICREEGVGVVMVAHDVNPILPYLDRVVYIAEGGAAAGRPEEVITTETLSRLYGTRVEVLRTHDGRLVVVGQPEAPAIHAARHPTGPADPPAGPPAGGSGGPG
ncbi:metal ABC transporter ATP-binding protein [Streptomyces sp. P1-3]|uniref:metal ABC transporter ATP-binding protein n=1 Tax=Streptomyces sp. P1-3 TaxID=3421658 RepID=UPI003D35EBC1